MMRDKQAVMVVMTMVVVLVVVMSGVEGASLTCGVHCTCDLKEDIQKDYKVTCNATMLLEATMTDSVFESLLQHGRGVPHLVIAANYSTHRTHVRVDGSPSLALTFDVQFFKAWRQFSSCSLDVIGAASITFPELEPFVHNTTLGHYFAGLGLGNVTAREVPIGLFSGKEAAGLRLENSTVERLPAGLFKGADSLYYLEVINSTVGVLEGPLGEPALSTQSLWLKEKDLPVLLKDSSVGLFNSGAVRLRTGWKQKILLQDVSLGRVQPGAVEVEGAGKVVLRQCTVARMEPHALMLGQSARLTLTGSWLAVLPDALTRYPCDGQGDHRISDNHFTLLHHRSAAAAAASPAPQHGDGGAAAVRLVEAVHHTCVAANLPPPAPLGPVPWSAIAVEQMVAFGAVGALLGAAVACLAIVVYRHHCRRGRDPEANPPPPVLMSHLLGAAKEEEPIYEEPLPMSPCSRAPQPPLPPLPQPSPRLGCTLDRREGCCGGGQDRCAAAPTMNHYTTTD